MDPGEYVIDTDDDDPDLAVVMHQSETPIEEWTINPPEREQRTVAEDNPEYDADEPTVVVAFVEGGLDQHWPEWTGVDPADLYDRVQETDVKLYHFPESRLMVLGEQQVAEFTAPESTVAMDDLRARFEDADWETEMENEELVVEKLGEQYRISPTGEVKGDGQVRDSLENIVAQYME